ncbi:MAG: hypothetical protein LBI37_03235, partial [Puniceicoccales bacterium]|nr:hypothetical protein [Puniceicoccales bacterium]
MISREEVNLILILQGYDTRLIFLTERLESLPGDRAKIEGTMAKEKKKLSDLKAKSSGVEMEFSRVNFDLELLGQKLIELKIKQSSIKNSKKYDLAQSQIAALEEKIEQLENDSIRLLYSLDDLKIEQDRVVDEVNLCLDNLNGELAQ